MKPSKIEQKDLEATKLNLVIALNELMFYVSILPSREETDAIRKVIRSYTSSYIKDCQKQGNTDELHELNDWLTCDPPRPVRQAAEEAWQERMEI
jgi:hypothetical protein|tara:strand:- start:568 stop:852 length:285 start_codon:yes stop_codon:yes gene_type:complete